MMPIAASKIIPRICRCRCGCQETWRPSYNSEGATRCHACRARRTRFCKRPANPSNPLAHLWRDKPGTRVPVGHRQDLTPEQIETILQREQQRRKYQAAMNRRAQQHATRDITAVPEPVFSKPRHLTDEPA